MVIGAFGHVTFALPDGHSGAGQPSVWGLTISGNLIEQISEDGDAPVDIPVETSMLTLGCRQGPSLSHFSFFSSQVCPRVIVNKKV